MTTEFLNVCKSLVQREFNPKETANLLTSYGFKFWSWGCSKMSNFINKGLLLKVSGHHHKGYVFITLNWMDVYDVHLITTRGRIKETIKDVYFENLFDVIDTKIERIPEYSN